MIYIYTSLTLATFYNYMSCYHKAYIMIFTFFIATKAL